jgi:pimeloyl-ACP methyl ester carboxylesterase
VQWDQPGSGSTGLRNIGHTGPTTIERYVGDAVAVTEWARRRLGVRKVVLFGSSWGSLLGLELAHRRPDLFSAYVGTSQPVGARGALVGYQMALDAARQRGDEQGVAALTRIGPPPYRSFEDFMVGQRYSNPPGLPSTPAQVAATNELIGVMTNPQPGASYVSSLPAPPGFDGGLMAAIQATWQEAWSWEARHLGTRFAIPIFIFQGEVDVNTPTSVAREYFDEIEAPVKRFEVVPGAGHDVMLFHDALLRLLEADVLPVVRRAAGDR